MNIDIGIAKEPREQIAKGLSHLLADTYTIYLKTQNYHWNVTGPMFTTLHTLFETHYTELAAAVDMIAERIRALGILAPGSYRQFGELTSIQESVEVPAAESMIEDLLQSNETVARTARSIFPIAEKAGDQATCDLVTERMQLHEKNAWMLRSLLK